MDALGIVTASLALACFVLGVTAAWAPSARLVLVLLWRRRRLIRRLVAERRRRRAADCHLAAALGGLQSLVERRPAERLDLTLAASECGNYSEERSG